MPMPPPLSDPSHIPTRLLVVAEMLDRAVEELQRAMDELRNTGPEAPTEAAEAPADSRRPSNIRRTNG